MRIPQAVGIGGGEVDFGWMERLLWRSLWQQPFKRRVF